MKIAIVEDNDLFARGLEIFLNSLNHEVIKIYSNGYDFLNDIENYHVDLILVDLHLPNGLNGYETGKLFNFKMNYIPMILVTMAEDSLDLESLVKYGFKGCVLKKNVYDKLPIAIDMVMNDKLYFTNLK